VFWTYKGDGLTKITTVLMDYDGTLHNHEAVVIQGLEGIFGLSGKELHRIYKYDIHRAQIHTKHLDRHDDMMFHCELLFKHLRKPFDPITAGLIMQIFDEAAKKAREDPIYFPDAFPALQVITGMGISVCLSTGRDADEKARTMVEVMGTDLFDHVISESKLGFLKTEREYYLKALEITGSKPTETVSIGDTPLSDIRPAKLINIKTIWLNRTGEPQPAEVDQTANYEVETLEDAIELLKDME
jgi:HAD superfamily hydrolase (TIGR01549 family)